MLHVIRLEAMIGASFEIIPDPTCSATSVIYLSVIVFRVVQANQFLKLPTQKPEKRDIREPPNGLIPKSIYQDLAHLIHTRSLAMLFPQASTSASWIRMDISKRLLGHLQHP